MDSCHIFNLIFGTKKATTELSRCFSNIGENAAAAAARDGRRQHAAKATPSPAAAANHIQGEPSSYPHDGNQANPPLEPPRSPLKQLQSKLVGLVSKVQHQVKHAERPTGAAAGQQVKLDSRAELVDAQSGTYRATLVRSSSEYDESENTDEQTSSHPAIRSLESAASVNSSQSHEQRSQQPASTRSVEIVENPLQQQDNDEPNFARRGRDKQTAAGCYETSQQHNGQPIDTNGYTSNDKNYYNTDDGQQSIRAEPGGVRQAPRAQVICQQPKAAGMVVATAAAAATAAANERANDKRSLYVRNLVRSIESGRLSIDGDQVDYGAASAQDDGRINPVLGSDGRARLMANNTFGKPVTLVKPMPPKAPPKSFRAKCIRHQLSLNKPTKVKQLFQDETFLSKFFDSLEPLERCAAAQVCRRWRDILYSEQRYWRGLINVIDCTQLRRDHLVECIVNTLQSAKLKQQQHQHHRLECASSSSSSGARQVAVKRSSSSNQPSPTIGGGGGGGGGFELCSQPPSGRDENGELGDEDSLMLLELGKRPQASAGGAGGGGGGCGLAGDTIFGFDQEDVWRIQELCNRFALQKHNNHSIFKPQSDSCNGGNQTNLEQQQQQQQTYSASKSSSIPSQISSTFSSASLSSILSPLSESSRVDNMKEKLYTSIDNRGFNAICLFGATDDDIEDLACKLPASSHERITIGRLNNCSITNRGLDQFVSTFRQIIELELTGCNELSNSLDLSALIQLKRLIITDCINIADGLAQSLMKILHRLDELTIQAYHLTDAFIEFLSLNCDTTKLRRLELQNCKEITNQSVIVLAKHFPQLKVLSLSGSTKISDDGIELLAEQAIKLRTLDLSWCSRITDTALECIACELNNSLTDLILDRNVNITDTGLGYLASMNELTSLQIRWCPRITDTGIESLVRLRSLRQLSLAGIHQITVRSLLCLVEMDLAELELTNCPAVNDDLVMFLSTKLPNCNIIF